MLTNKFMPTIASAVNPYCSYNSVHILDIEYGINDYVIISSTVDKIRVANHIKGEFHPKGTKLVPNLPRYIFKCKIRYENNEDGRAYFKYGTEKIYLDECIRTNLT